MNYISTPG